MSRWIDSDKTFFIEQALNEKFFNTFSKRKWKQLFGFLVFCFDLIVASLLRYLAQRTFEWNWRTRMMWYMILRSATLLTLWIGRVGDNDGVVGNVVSVVNDDNVNTVDWEAARVQRRSLDRVRTCTNLQQKLHSMLLTTDTSKSKGIWLPQLITSLWADQKPKYSWISGTVLVFSKQIWFL